MSQIVQMFARLAKVDVEKRQVTGVIASETPDHANEVFDYDTSKPHFEKWSGMVAKLSGGQSVGNVRAMHGKVAAGTLSEIAFDDVQKTITVVADIVDDNEWNKVLKGVYTGFSIGGGYVKRWADKVNKSLKRYTANPSEVSLVDIGCNPDATFTMCKANGVETEVKFEDTVHGILSKMTDPETSPDELPALSLALAKAYGNEIPEAAPAEGGDEEELTKGAYSIGELARLADSVSSFCRYDAVCYNNDGTTTSRTFTPELKAAATALYDALLKLVAEDVEAAKLKIKELKKEFDDEQAEPLRKAADEATANAETLAKVAPLLGLEEGELFSGIVDKLTKTLGEHDELRKAHDEQTTKLKEVTNELEKIKAEPAPAKGVAVVVAKESDGLQKVNDALSLKNEDGSDKSPADLMKAVHATGGARLLPGSVLAKQHQ